MDTDRRMFMPDDQLYREICVVLKHTILRSYVTLKCSGN